MEIIAKISKGSKMDQIYLPKNRIGFDIGNYVIIKPINKIIENKTFQEKKKFYFNGIKSINSLKLEIISRIIEIIDKSIEDYENIFIAGSFLEEGFNFKDIDVIILTEEKLNKKIESEIKGSLNLEMHLIFMNKSQFIEALKIDPLWILMLNQCISIKRLAPSPLRKINYKYLDAQLIKSKTLIENFDYSTGDEKYKLIRNLMTIYLFIKNQQLSKGNVEKEMIKKFNIEIDEFKNNLINKEKFLKKYKNLYFKLEKEIIKNASK